MTKQKRFLLACALLVVCSVAVFSLSSRDYRVYWTARDGTVIGGVTPDGRLDTLSGAIHGGDVEINGDLAVTGDLDVTGTITTGSGLTWTPPLTLDGDLSVLGDVAFGANSTEFTVAAATGNTEIAGTLVVTGLTTLTGGLTVPTGAAVTIAGTSTLTVGTGAVTLGGALRVTGDASFYGSAVFAGPVTHSQTASGFAMISVGQVTFADVTQTDAATYVDLFVLPAGAIVLDVVVVVAEEFDSDTATMSVGYTLGNEFVDALDLTTEGVRRAGDDTEIPATAVHHSVGAEAVTVQAECTITSELVPTEGSAWIHLYWTLIE